MVIDGSRKKSLIPGGLRDTKTPRRFGMPRKVINGASISRLTPYQWQSCRGVRGFCVILQGKHVDGVLCALPSSNRTPHHAIIVQLGRYKIYALSTSDERLLLQKFMYEYIYWPIDRPIEIIVTNHCLTAVNVKSKCGFKRATEALRERTSKSRCLTFV